MLKRFLLYSIAGIAAGVLMVNEAWGQDSTGAWISVRSNLPSSLVLVDSAYAGEADGSLLAIGPGLHRILLVPSEVGAWDLHQPTSVIEIGEGDTLSLEIKFPYQYRIDSVPYGALVTLESERLTRLGKTPLIHTSDSLLTGRLFVEKDGYASAEIDPGENVINRHSVVLVPIDAALTDDLAVEWNPRGSSTKWVNWAAAGLVLAGGALAVHYKFTADEEYDRYLETGDPEIKEVVDRYDTYSYVALGAMQVGIGILAIRLAF